MYLLRVYITRIIVYITRNIYIIFILEEMEEGITYGI